jgi:opacity protein-like surface antigen
MDRRERSGVWMSIIRRAAYPGVVILFLAFLPGLLSADEPWTGGPRPGLLESTAGSAAESGASQSLVAALTPGSVLLAQAGVPATGAAPSGWQFTIGPYLWAPRAEIDLTVGPLTRSTTIEFFDDIVDNLDLSVSGHFEANWREWTGLLDLMYLKLGKDETTGAGIQTDLDYEQLFFEFGGTYRFATLPMGRTGRITLEALAGARLMYIDAELTIGGQSRSRTTTLIDPMVGGRIAYHITDTIALWFRGDVAGFGISDTQSELTYNLIAGLNWRFTRVASAFVGWRYMHVDVESGTGLGTLDTDVSFNGPFLGVSFYF